jgi:cytochrome b561
MPIAPANSSGQLSAASAVRRRIRGGDWFWMALAVLIPLTGWFLQVVGTDHVSVLGNSSWQLPDICYSRSWLGVDCPACGMTRSTIHLVHGQLAESLSVHRLGWLVLLVILAQVPYRLLIPWQQRVSDPRWIRYEMRMWAGLGILLILNRIWDVLV